MAHLLDLSPDQRDELISLGVAAILPRVILSGQMKGSVSTNAAGVVTFSPNYQTSEFDVTKGIRNNRLVIKLQVPVLPTQNGRSSQAGDVQVQIDNTVHYVATVQEGAFLDYNNLQDLEFTITVECGGMTPLPIYRGKVIQQPTEEEGLTTFQLAPTIWDILDVELVLEKATGGDIETVFSVDPTTGVITNTTYTDPLLRVEHFHGIVTFDEWGQSRAAITNDSAEKIDLTQVDFSDYTEPLTGITYYPLLGKYTLEFFSETGFQVTQPDNQVFTGNTALDFTQGYLSIPATAWNILSDPTGAKLELFAYYTVKGNPVSMVKNLLYKALSGNWGYDFSADPALPVDWSTLATLESMYDGTTIYVSETNRDNEVFSPHTPDKPFRIRDFCQKILDHIGCQLTFTPEGKLTVNSSWYLLPSQQVRQYTSSQLSSGTQRAASHRIFGGNPRFDAMIIRYGLNAYTGNYAGKYEFREGVRTKYNSLSAAYDYYKSGIHDFDIAGMDSRTWAVVKKSDIRLEMSLLPNWGLPVNIGDRFSVSFTVQPILPNTANGLGEFWEIYDINKPIGDVVKVQAKAIPEPVAIKRICEFVICTNVIC